MTMEPGIDYKITKIEKGPLNRFKNQNLLLKKFGELGLHIYKAITGKRTAEELRKDLEIEPDIFAEMLSYMEEAGMIELTAVESGSAKAEKPKEEEKKEGIEEPEPIKKELAPPWVKKDLLKPKEESEEGKRRDNEKEPELSETPDEIEPIEIEPIGLEEEIPEKEEQTKKKAKEEEPIEKKVEEKKEELEPIEAE